jgi:hypothetical protein
VRRLAFGAIGLANFPAGPERKASGGGEPPYFAIGNRRREFAVLDANRHAGGRDGVSDKTEASYRHGTAIEKRRKLMASWTEFCRSPPVTKIGKVVPIRGHQ